MLNFLIPAISALTPLLFGRGGNDQDQPAQPAQPASDPLAQLTPEMVAMFRHQLARQQALDPLFSNVVGMANARLPTWARGSGPAMPAMGATAPGAGASGAAGNAGGPGFGQRLVEEMRRRVQPMPAPPRPSFAQPIVDRMRGTSPAQSTPTGPRALGDLQALIRLLQSIRGGGGM